MTPILFVEYPKCTTCQKAKQWLVDHQLEFTDRHIVEDRPTETELKKWHSASGLPLKRFFNTSGLLYKDMGLKDKLDAMDEQEQIKLLATNGMLVKRPIIVTGDVILVGFRPAEWEAALVPGNGGA